MHLAHLSLRPRSLGTPPWALTFYKFFNLITANGQNVYTQNDRNIFTATEHL